MHCFLFLVGKAYFPGLYSAKFLPLCTEIQELEISFLFCNIILKLKLKINNSILKLILIL